MKVKFYCSTHDFQSEAISDIEEFDDNTTEKELYEMAEEFFWNEKQPCWWYEIIPRE